MVIFRILAVAVNTVFSCFILDASLSHIINSTATDAHINVFGALSGFVGYTKWWPVY